MTIYSKSGKIQFWGTSKNPGHTGSAFHEDCCPCGCFAFFDDFNRADSTNLGSNWYEEVGDWGIEDFKLVEEYDASVGTANAVVMCQQGIPSLGLSDNGMVVSISVDQASTVVGDKYHIYVACTDPEDSSTGLEVEFEVIDDDPTTWRTTIAGETAVDQVPTLWGTPGAVRIYVCVDFQEDMVKAGVLSLTDAPAWVEKSVTPGRYSGVGHNNTGHQNIFDDFNIIEIRTPTIICSTCFCYCDLVPIPRELTATVVDGINRSSCIDGVSWDMDWEFDSTMEKWVGTSSFEDDSSNTLLVDWELECESQYDTDYPGQNFILTAKQNPTVLGVSCNFMNVPMRATSDSTCPNHVDGLSLVFGPFLMQSSDLICTICHDPLDPPAEGSFYVVITIRP